MAEKFSEYEKFFFVYQMDFRGRKYVTSSFLSPQGPDYARALLEFEMGNRWATEADTGWLFMVQCLWLRQGVI